MWFSTDAARSQYGFGRPFLRVAPTGKFIAPFVTISRQKRAACFPSWKNGCVRYFWNEVLGFRALLLAAFHPPCICWVCALNVCYSRGGLRNYTTALLTSTVLLFSEEVIAYSARLVPFSSFLSGFLCWGPGIIIFEKEQEKEKRERGQIHSFIIDIQHFKSILS